MNLKPIGDRVIIEPAEAESKTKSGIIIPGSVKEKPLRGHVIAVGPGKNGDLMTIAEGDFVLYGRYAGTTITYDEKEYLIMREDDVFAIVD